MTARERILYAIGLVTIWGLIAVALVCFWYGALHILGNLW